MEQGKPSHWQPGGSNRSLYWRTCRRDMPVFRHAKVIILAGLMCARKIRIWAMTLTPPKCGDEIARRMPVGSLGGQHVAASWPDARTPRGCRTKSRMTDGKLYAAALRSSPLICRLIACRPVPVMARYWIGRRHARNAPASLRTSASAPCCPWLCIARHRQPESANLPATVRHAAPTARSPV